MMAILYSIKHMQTLNPDLIKKKKTKYWCWFKRNKKKKSSSNIQAQIVSQTYLHQQIKTKTAGAVVKKNNNFCTIPPTTHLDLYGAKCSFTTTICLHHNIWRSSHRPLFTSGSLFPEGSAGTERKKTKMEWMRRLSRVNFQETGPCWVSRCQAPTGSSHWDSLFQPRASVHLLNVPPESNALNRVRRKGGKVCTKQWREKPCAEGSRGTMMAELV